jgi:hypothetical protein
MRMNRILVAVGAITCLLGFSMQVPIWQLRPELRLGGPEGGPETVERAPTFVLIGDDGLIYISQRCELRVFDTDGRFVRRIGRCGEGPGEFRSVSRAGFANGSLWIADRLALRVTLYPEDGRGVETVRVDHFRSIVGEVMRPEAVLSDGSILVRVERSPGPGLTHREVLIRVSTAGEIIDTLAAYRGTSQPIRIRTSAGLHTLPFPAAAPDTRWDFSPDGRYVALAHVREDRNQIIVGVEVVEPGNRRVFRQEIRRDITPAQRRAQRQVRDNAVEQLTQQLSRAGVSTREARRAVDEALGTDVTYSFVSYIVMDADHRIWVRLATGDPGTAHYVVLDGRGGSTIGEIRMSLRGRVVAARGRAAWLFETDEMGIPYAVRHRIEQRGQPQSSLR